MPQFYFHVSFGGHVYADDEGQPLPDRAAARQYAYNVLSELTYRSPPHRWAGWILRLTDEDGEFLALPLVNPELVVAQEH